MDVALDCLYIFVVLLLRISVVEAQIACATEFLGSSEIHDKGLGMTYVEVSVGFRREAGIKTAAVFAISKVLLNLLFNKVKTAFIHYGLIQYLAHK